MEPILIVAPPIIAGLVQAVRPALGEDGSKWLPIVSVFLGVCVVAMLAVSGQVTWPDVPLAGLLSGLSASGLYSVVHRTMGAAK